MDSAAQLTSMASTEVLKEPRGFIKFIQIGLAIFAFATTTAYYGSTSYTIQCHDSLPSPPETTISFSYPYQLNTNTLAWNSCRNNNSSTISTISPPKYVYGDYTSASQFYVFVGVTAFLYSLGILIFYVFADHLYQNMDAIPVADFVVTAVYVVLWLISSCAWADAVSKIKHYTNPNSYFTKNFVCECDSQPVDGCLQATCSANEGNYATINVSIIFGFLCMCVWGGNLWFLYKDTKWYKASRNDQMTSSQPSTPGSMPQQI